MGRFLTETANYKREVNMPEFWGYCSPPPKKYGFFSFIGDIIMLCLTGGLWFIWIFVREMRRR